MNAKRAVSLSTSREHVGKLGERHRLATLGLRADCSDGLWPHPLSRVTHRGDRSDPQQRRTERRQRRELGQRFVASVVSNWKTSGDVRIAPVNGGVGLLREAGGRLRAVMTIAPGQDGRRVESVFIVVNPEKLGGSAPP